MEEIEEIKDKSIFTPDQSLIAQADLQDADDCAKMLICTLNTKKPQDLDQVEQTLKDMFGPDERGGLNLNSTSVRFDLAAMIGKQVGINQCYQVYGRCDAPYDQLLDMIESFGEDQGMNNENYIF